MEKFSEKSAVKKRAIAKRKLTYIEKFLNKYTEEVSVNEVRSRLSSLPDILIQYEEIQDEIELNCQDPTGHFADREKFMDDYYRIKAALEGIVDTEVKVPSPPASVISNNSDSLVKLPTIEIPIFDGNVRTWLQFHDIFSSLILNNESLNNIQKFHYLVSSLRGEAKGLLESLTISADNFETAWKLLYDRYNNNKIIAANYVKSLLNLPTVKTGSSNEYRSLVNNATSNKRALESLKPNVPLHDVILVEVILERLRKQDRQEWELKTANDQFSSLQDLIAFIEIKAQALEITEHRNNPSDQRVKSSISSSKALTVNVNSVSCIFCNRNNHSLHDCRDFKAVSIVEKRRFLQENKLCFSCLKGSHVFAKCKVRCAVCSKRHHKLLHIDNANSNANATSNISNVSSYTSSKGQNIANAKALLPTVAVHVEAKNGDLVGCRALMDSGSQMSFISTDLVKKLHLPLVKNKFSVSGINDVCAAKVMHTCSVNVHSRISNYEFNVNCAVLDNVTGLVPTAPVQCKDWSLPTNISLADPEFHIPAKIDLLLGADVFFDLVIGETLKRKGYPTLINTHLGYVLSGKMPLHSIRHTNNEVMSCLSRNDMLDNQLRKFWELEEINHIPQTKEDKYCEQHFIENTSRTSDGRFIVRLPVRLEVSIGDSFGQARKRMSLLERKFESNEKLHHDYAQFMKEYEDLGHMELCDMSDESTQFFIPHHAVFKLNSSTTKIRVVFDGSAKSSNNYSLNDLLCVGPTVQEDLYSIVLRFRKYPVAMTADIAKMYRQVLVDPRDRCLQKILWRSSTEEELKCYKLSTVTYGTSPASFLATRCLKQLADENQEMYPAAAEALRSDFYVDDYLGGVSTVEEAKRLQTQLIDLLASAGFPLRKWSSNCDEVLQNVAPELQERPEKSKIIGDNTVQALGITWQPENDCFQFKFDVKPITKVTKRNVLSVVSSIFDPLGILAPAVIKCKIFIQRLWTLKIGWDEILPASAQDEWNKIYDNLHCLNDINVDRKIIPSANPQRIELHGFSDSSEQAYGACIYLRSIADDNSVSVSLVTSKSRVSPIKTQSVPRLELCGALLLSRLLKKVLSSLKLSRLDQIYLWSDSTIVLCWLKSTPNKLKSFVANRVSEIQDDTDINCWHHISTEENPADCITRGVYPDQLSSLKLWWRGPTFLWEVNSTSSLTPIDEIQLPIEIPDVKSSKEETVTCAVNVKQSSSLNDLIKKFSSIDKLKRIFSYILRFIHNVRSVPEKRRCEHLTVEETDASFIAIISLVQQEEYHEELSCLMKNKCISNSSKLRPLCPFLDKDGLLRVGGRLNNSDLPYETKHQIIVPAKHHITELLIRNEHIKLLHGGTQSVLSSLRRNIWIPAGRNVVRKVLRSCIVCFKVNASSNNQLMGQLPSNRVRPAHPFEYTGVDYAGPVHLKVGLSRSKTTIKAYVALFICLVTKAVHLELVSQLTTDAFLAALKRFIARRGRCKEMMSDNGTNFIGAAAELKGFLQDPDIQKTLYEYGVSEGFNWKFIPPRSPHFGGIWESGIKSMKSHLKKVIGNTVLTFEEYATILSQVEACLNSRPLSPLTDDPQCLNPITPGHFLIGRPLQCIPEPSMLHIPTGKLSRWQHLQQMMEHFWKRWSSDYLTELQRRPKWLDIRSSLSIGDLVLVKEDNVPPLCWKTGKVIEVFTGKDGLVRVVKLKTATSEIHRPIVKLCPFPSKVNS